MHRVIQVAVLLCRACPSDLAEGQLNEQLASWFINIPMIILNTYALTDQILDPQIWEV